NESSRAVAKRLTKLNIDHKTVESVRKFMVANGTLEHFSRLIGLDGKERRMGGPRHETIVDDPVYTSVYGFNADLIAEVAKLYFRPGDRIADVTFGKGNFWNRVDLEQYQFFPSDANHPKHPYDFRELPYPDASFEIVAFDPPYIQNSPY